jgi:hypothetical protein
MLQYVHYTIKINYWIVCKDRKNDMATSTCPPTTMICGLKEKDKSKIFKDKYHSYSLPTKVDWENKQWRDIRQDLVKKWQQTKVAMMMALKSSGSIE